MVGGRSRCPGCGFEEICEFLCDKNVTNSVNQQIFLKKITIIGDILLTGNVTKIGEKSFTKKSENFSESIKFSIKKSPKLAKIQGNHQNW